MRREDGLLDYEELERLARTEQPKMIIAGGSAYPRAIDFARIRAVADEVGALFLVDMAHYAGLVATGLYPSPFPHAHIVTTTTHKTLRGPRGGMILTNDEDLAKKINSAVFPGLQGGPLMHVIAGKAAAFGEALAARSSAPISVRCWTTRGCWARRCASWAATSSPAGPIATLCWSICGRRTPRARRPRPAWSARGMTANKNAIPYDPAKPAITSGIRLGSPAATTRGFGVAEFRQVGEMINEVLEGLSRDRTMAATPPWSRRWQAGCGSLCARFPIY